MRGLENLLERSDELTRHSTVLRPVSCKNSEESLSRWHTPRKFRLPVFSGGSFSEPFFRTVGIPPYNPPPFSGRMSLLHGEVFECSLFKPDLLKTMLLSGCCPSVPPKLFSRYDSGRSGFSAHGLLFLTRFLFLVVFFLAESLRPTMFRSGFFYTCSRLHL